MEWMINITTLWQCPKCKVQYSSLPVSKHQLWDEQKHHTLVTGKGCCTNCGIGSDGITPLN
jgi:hypothetical protein